MDYGSRQLQRAFVCNIVTQLAARDRPWPRAEVPIDGEEPGLFQKAAQHPSSLLVHIQAPSK
jgi:hypothetical protein